MDGFYYISPQGFRIVEPAITLIAARLAPHQAVLVQQPTEEDWTGY